MSELIFILVTIYVAYVIHAVLNDNKVEANVEAKHDVVSHDPMIEALNPGATETASIEVAATVALDELKNPKTGEISKIPNNYRFGKRWIKEALVSEGLLDKIYKNNELSDEVNAKIHSALLTLAQMENYKV